MQAVRIENFIQENWRVQLQPRILRRYPGATFEQRNISVALIRLNTTKPWAADDEAFFTELRTQDFFQRWEPLAEVPPVPKHNKAVYEDIGYRIGSGERLTLKQQEMLLSQLHNLEERALHAEHEAREQRIRADMSEEFTQSTIQRHNAMAAILSVLDRELHIKVDGDINGLCTVEDTETGKVLLRDTPFAEVYRTALQYRLKALS